MTDWFYGKDGTQHGPVTEHEIATLIASGQVDASTIIWREGMTDWLPFNQVPEFQPVSQQTPGAPIYAPGQATHASPQIQVPIPTDGLSIASLVCGILALLACYIWGLFGLAAVICGHISLKKIKASATPVQGRGMAIAGLICGYIGIVIQIIVIVAIAFAFANAQETMKTTRVKPSSGQNSTTEEPQAQSATEQQTQQSPATETPTTETP